MMAFSIVLLPVSATAQAADNAGPFFGEGIDYEALEDLETYVRSRYAWLNRALLDEAAKGTLGTEPGLLTVRGKDHPELIGLGYALWQFDRGAATRKALSERGFPPDQLSVLDHWRNEGSYPKYQQGFLDRLTVDYAAVLDPREESTDQEIADFIRAYHGLLRQTIEDWALEALSQLGHHGRRALLSYLDEVFVPEAVQHYADWSHPSDVVVHRYRTLLCSKLARADWSRPDGRSRAQTRFPPRTIRRESDGILQWLSAESLRAHDGRLFFGKERSPLSDLLSEPEIRSIITKIDRRAGRDAALPDCFGEPRRSDQPARETLRQIVPRACAVFTATIETTTPGFYYREPHALLSLEIEAWLRAPLSGAENHFYALYPRTRFEIGEATFCNRKTSASRSLEAGSRVLILETRDPYQKEAGILYPDPTLIFTEDEQGRLFIHPSRSSDPAFAGIVDLDGLIERVREMVDELPYRVIMVPGRDF